MDTIVLTRSQIAPLLDPDAILPALARGFVAYSAERRIPAQRVRSPLPGSTSAMLLFPGLAPEIQAYTVTVQAKNPAQNPASGGIIALHDLPTGALLAILDAGFLTAVRTGFSGALGAHTLANPEAGDVAVIGAGNQGGFLLRGLARLRPIKRVFVYDVNPAQASLYAKRAEDDLRVPIIVSDSVASAVGDADIIFHGHLGARGLSLQPLDSTGRAHHHHRARRTGQVRGQRRADPAQRLFLRRPGPGGQHGSDRRGRSQYPTDSGRTWRRSGRARDGSKQPG
jgi:hypothetical protein